MRAQVHPSAIVDHGAQIKDGARIWHFVHVCAGARIGKGCSLGRQGLKSVELLIATYLSARDGSRVSLPLDC